MKGRNMELKERWEGERHAAGMDGRMEGGREGGREDGRRMEQELFRRKKTGAKESGQEDGI